MTWFLLTQKRKRKKEEMAAVRFFVFLGTSHGSMINTQPDLNIAGFTQPTKHMGWVWILKTPPIAGSGWVLVLVKPTQTRPVCVCICVYIIFFFFFLKKKPNYKYLTF